jgi:Calcineurin-like phosphoesterase
MQKEINIVSITDNSILIRYALFSSEKISYKISPGNIGGTLKEANSTGRFEVAGLQADKEYKATISWGGKVREIKFSTLPAPEGELLCKYAIVGDPHLSAKTENRFGRLHVEGQKIFESIISQVNSLKVDFVLSTGDLTECGSPAEYKMLEQVLSALKCPFLSVSGNHDFGYEKQSYDLWQKHFGPLSWSKNIKSISIAGLDTHRGLFNTEANNEVLKNLRNKALFIILSHYQLFEDEHILDSDKAVEDIDSAVSALNQIKDKKGIIYIGHKNVPARVFMGNLLQVNVPQPTHYPCGFLVASMYSNGIYHRFEPIFSEVLNEYSRKETASRNSRASKPEYRDCKLAEKWNFIYKFDKNNIL